MKALGIQIAGEQVLLWPDRALAWPAGRTLFIADPHFGKAAAFRHLGVAAPDPTATDLDRLDALLAANEDPRRLVILGDFLHARAGRTRAILETFGAWRARRHALEVILVRGNHDQDSGDPPAEWRIHTVGEPWQLAPFACRHSPRHDPKCHTLAGHVHPGLSLSDSNGARLRAPCFVIHRDLTILPAFGTFTGMEIVDPGADTTLYAIGPGVVLRIR